MVVQTSSDNGTDMATKIINFYSVEELYDFLRDNNVSSDVSDRVKSNQINGELFLELTSDELKEIAPVLGDRVTLRKLQAKLADQVSVILVWH